MNTNQALLSTLWLLDGLRPQPDAMDLTATCLFVAKTLGLESGYELRDAAVQALKDESRIGDNNDGAYNAERWAHGVWDAPFGEYIAWRHDGGQTWWKPVSDCDADEYALVMGEDDN
jgi:hypothetical protein